MVATGQALRLGSTVPSSWGGALELSHYLGSQIPKLQFLLLVHPCDAVVFFWCSVLGVVSFLCSVLGVMGLLDLWTLPGISAFQRPF